MTHCQHLFFFFFFFYQGFLHRHWRFTGQQGKGGDHLLFHSTTSTRSRTLRHLFATLHVRWLSRIFNCKLVFTRLLLDEIYHLIELPFEWLIDDAMFVCLLDELILGFCYSDLVLKTGGFELTSTITLVLQANWLTIHLSFKLMGFLNILQKHILPVDIEGLFTEVNIRRCK